MAEGTYKEEGQTEKSPKVEQNQATSVILLHIEILNSPIGRKSQPPNMLFRIERVWKEIRQQMHHANICTHV